MCGETDLDLRGASPLEGKTLISTRPRVSRDELVVLLRDKGARVIEIPAIEIKPLNNIDIIRLTNLRAFSHLIFTSKNGVDCFFDLLGKERIEFPGNIKVGVVGASTAEAVKRRGVDVEIVSTGTTGNDFAQYLLNEVAKTGDKFLLALGAKAGSTIEDSLKTVCEVCRVNVYDTVIPQGLRGDLSAILNNNKIDGIVLSSPSAVENVLHVACDAIADKGIPLLCIGKTTGDALVNKGIRSILVSSSPQPDAFATEIVDFIKNG